MVGMKERLSKPTSPPVCPVHAWMSRSASGLAEIQWDKDGLDTMGLLKVDILALGMLSTLRWCFDLGKSYRGKELQEDKPTYAMISPADTLGVFQIESRAQMAMLPRLGPQTF